VVVKGVRDATGVEPLVTVEEAAAFLGVQVGTIYLWAECERIPSYKVGNLRRFRLSELDAHIKARRTGPSGASKWDPPGPAGQEPVA
jgi:excisionase family DNA binding protein